MGSVRSRAYRKLKQKAQGRIEAPRAVTFHSERWGHEITRSTDTRIAEYEKQAAEDFLHNDGGDAE